jgi:hypothetical protein
MLEGIFHWIRGIRICDGAVGFLDVIYWARGCLGKRGMVNS